MTEDQGRRDNAVASNQFDRLFQVASSEYDVFSAPDGRLYGVSRAQPHRAYLLPTAGSSGGLLDEIWNRFYNRHLTWPTTARAPFADYLRMRARLEPIRRVHTRSAWCADERVLYVNVGDPDWSVIRLDEDGWQVDDAAPVVFRRTAHAAAMQLPADPRVLKEQALDHLWALVPVVEADRPLVLALLLTAWLTGVPQPIVFVSGPRDSGKSVTTRFLLSLVDPVTQDRGGSLPRNEAEWKARIGTARVIMLDNIGHIHGDDSDLLCRVATGGEASNRELYSNDASHVTELRVPVWLTSIGLSAPRDDLATRLIRIELTPLDPSHRLAESDLVRRQNAARPIITGGLLDLMVDVLSCLPHERAAGGLTHRMGDFELILRGVDRTFGSSGAARLAAMGAELAGDVVGGDIVAQALLAGVKYEGVNDYRRGSDGREHERRNLLGEWSPSELLTELEEHASETVRRSQSWPKTANVLTKNLDRIAPALEESEGVRVTTGLRAGKARNRLIRIERII